MNYILNCSAGYDQKWGRSRTIYWTKYRAGLMINIQKLLRIIKSFKNTSWKLINVNNV